MMTWLIAEPAELADQKGDDMKTLVVMNEKGGVGKTNIVAHAGWYFAEGYRTLVVDLDQQANLTMTLGVVACTHPRSGAHSSV